jgi:hypothetical protein
MYIPNILYPSGDGEAATSGADAGGLCWKILDVLIGKNQGTKWPFLIAQCNKLTRG